jgi:hypothetical protein
MAIWFLIVILVHSTGEVDVVLTNASKPEFNTEEACEANAMLLGDRLLKNSNPDDHVYYVCRKITVDKLNQSLPEKI